MKTAAISGYSRMVPVEEIEKNEFNLNLPRYIDGQKAEDRQDIDGHLRGGIPQADIDALGAYWEICPKLKTTLFAECRPGYVELKVEKSDIKQTIFEHPEFTAFTSGMAKHFEAWRERTATKLKALKPGFHPKDLIFEISEDLLTHYTGKPLINKYDVYQHLMDYWSEVMQDDCYMIAADGWKAETYRIIEKDKKGKEKDKGWTCDLIPKELIVARFFADEQAEIERLNAELEAASSTLVELEEEHGGDEGAFAELDKVNKANVTARLKEIKGDREAAEEAAALNAWLKASNAELALKKKIKDADAALDKKALAHYPKLTEVEIKTLAVDDKWLAKIDADISGEMERISQALAGRVRTLAERYETRMPDLVAHVANLEAKVEQHLKRMGFAW